MFEPVRLMEQALLIAAATPRTRIEFSILVSTQPTMVLHSGMSPVPSPGARQLVRPIFTAPEGNRSGPVPSSETTRLHSVASPVLVTVTSVSYTHLTLPTSDLV